MNSEIINELNRRTYSEWKNINQEVRKLNRTHSCAVCDKRAERKGQIVAWLARCVGATASAAFHVALTICVVMALTEGVVF